MSKIKIAKTIATSSNRAIIFGAGAAGRAALKNISSQYTIVAFSDNNHQRLPHDLEGVPVLAPEDIKRVAFEKILIASEHFEQISKQLVDQLGIDEQFIEVLSANQIKYVHFQDSKQIADSAIDILLLVCQCLRSRGINYYVDAGTLLGIYRDNALIPWDDDLDISVLANELELVRQSISSLLPNLEQTTRTRWELQEFAAHRDFGAVKSGDVRCLKLIPESNGLPMMDFFVKYIDGECMDYTLASRGIRMPSYHAFNTQSHEFSGGVVSLPNGVEDYLEQHYGEWRVPKRDWNLSELKSATVYES